MATRGTLLVNPATGAIVAPTTATTFRNANGLQIGLNIQAWSASLDSAATHISWSGSNPTFASEIIATSSITTTTGNVIVPSGDVITGGGVFADTLSVDAITATGSVDLTGSVTSSTRALVGSTRTENPNSGTGDSTATPPSFSGDFTGQIANTNYNRIWWWDGAAWKSSAYLSGVLFCDGLKTVTGDSTHTLRIGTSTQQIDNVLTLQNMHNARHSAVRFCDLNGFEAGATGYGNPGASALFASANYSECFDTQNWNFVGASPKRVCFRLEGSTGDFVALSDDGSTVLFRVDQSADQTITTGQIVTTGSIAGVIIRGRDGSAGWQWYALNATRLDLYDNTGLVDVFRIENSSGTYLFQPVNTSTLGSTSLRWSNAFIERVTYGATGAPFDDAGSGTPEGNVTAPVGSTWRRTDGGAGTSFYVKESGTGNTGWTAK